jgi:hypothetical protein
MLNSHFARLAIPENLIEACPRAGQTMTPVSRVWHA